MDPSQRAYRGALSPRGRRCPTTRGLHVLDYGCGDGALLGLLSRETGTEGRATGLDPNDEARRLARYMLARRGLSANLVSSPEELRSSSFDRVICSEVIEHVHDVEGLIESIYRLLKPGGKAIVTTPIRLTESPEDPNHVREWFPGEFRALFENGPLQLERHEEMIPAATPEVFFWRPRFFLRVPVFRILCNVLSIYGGVNALAWLRMRPRLFMTQMAVLGKADRQPD